MKEERGLLRDETATDQPVEEGKVRKYIRIILACIGMALFVLVFVMAALRRFGS